MWRLWLSTCLSASVMSNVEVYKYNKDKDDVDSYYLMGHLRNIISRYKDLNKKIISIFVYSIVLFVFSTIAKYIQGSLTLSLCLCFIDVLLTIVLVAWLAILLCKVYKQYTFKE